MRRRGELSERVLGFPLGPWSISVWHVQTPRPRSQSFWRWDRSWLRILYWGRWMLMIYRR